MTLDEMNKVFPLRFRGQVNSTAHEVFSLRRLYGQVFFRAGIIYSMKNFNVQEQLIVLFKYIQDQIAIKRFHLQGYSILLKYMNATPQIYSFQANLTPMLSVFLYGQQNLMIPFMSNWIYEI